MSTSYHIYGNGGVAGAPVDYSTILATTASLSWVSGTLALSSSWKFGTRPFDTVSGLEDRNVDAVATLNIDGAGLDITNRPRPPLAVAVVPTGSGGLRIHWAYPLPAARQPWRPVGFHVYAGLAVPNYAVILATVLFVPYQQSFLANLSGYSDGSIVAAAVRAYNAAGEETNTNAVTAVVAGIGPAAVVSLLGVATAQIGVA